MSATTSSSRSCTPAEPSVLISSWLSRFGNPAAAQAVDGEHDPGVDDGVGLEDAGHGHRRVAGGHLEGQLVADLGVVVRCPVLGDAAPSRRRRSAASPSSMSSSSSPSSDDGSMADTYWTSPSSGGRRDCEPAPVPRRRRPRASRRRSPAEKPWPIDVADDVVADEVLLDRPVDAGLGRLAEDRHRGRRARARSSAPRRWPWSGAGCAARSGRPGCRPNRASARTCAARRPGTAGRSRGWRPPCRAARTGHRRPTNHPARGTSTNNPAPSRATPSDDQRDADQQPPVDRGLRQSDVVAQRLDGRDPGGTARRQPGRGHGDDDADDVRREDGAR